MSVTVYYLQHRIERGSEADEKAIGFYATPDAAAAAVERLRGLPGFSDPRGSFEIFNCDVDRTSWPERMDDPARKLSPDGSIGANETFLKHLKQVYLLWNMNDEDPDDFEALLGIFSSGDTAALALEALKRDTRLAAPGRQFGIDMYVLGDDHWRSGFVA
ncbi:MAG: hypothetical protein R3D68_14440 [Hyphomicrobiaceae bacterium]